MKKIALICGLCCLVILCAACADAPAPDVKSEPASLEQPTPLESPPLSGPTAAEEEETPAEDPVSAPALPAFSALDIYGESVESGVFTDYDLTMVNVWATFCGPCIMEMPDLAELAAAMPAGTQLLGLVGDALNEENIALAVTIAEDTGAVYPHIVPDETLYDYIRNHIVAYPTTLFIDAEGRLVGEPLIGAQSRAQYEEAINKRLEQMAASE